MDLNHTRLPIPPYLHIQFAPHSFKCFTIIARGGGEVKRKNEIF